MRILKFTTIARVRWFILLPYLLQYIEVKRLLDDDNIVVGLSLLSGAFSLGIKELITLGELLLRAVETKRCDWIAVEN